MNLERLLRHLETRLEHLPEAVRSEVRDALREEAARARRFFDPSDTVEAERERRVEAETLREVLEAISRQARLEDTIEEVLRQLARVVDFDSCSLGLIEDGHCRIIAARGFPESARFEGLRFRAPIIDEIRERRWPVSLPDVRADERFVAIEGSGPIRSWAGVPLLVEAEVIGILNLDRQRVDPFSEDDLHRARAVAFSAAAAIRNARLLEQVRDYAQLMEQAVAVDQAVLTRRPLDDVRRALLRGALRVGRFAWALLLEPGPQGAPRVTALSEDGPSAMLGREAPVALWSSLTRRIDPHSTAVLARELGASAPAGEFVLVPLALADEAIAVLVLLDADGDSPADRLLEAYGSRAATAFAHALSER